MYADGQGGGQCLQPMSNRSPATAHLAGTATLMWLYVIAETSISSLFSRLIVSF